VPGTAAATGTGAASGTAAALVRLLPFATVAIAPFVPLAAGLYLAASTAWTLAERVVFGRLPAVRQAIDRRGPAG